MAAIAKGGRGGRVFRGRMAPAWLGAPQRRSHSSGVSVRKRSSKSVRKTSRGVGYTVSERQEFDDWMARRKDVHPLDEADEFLNLLKVSKFSVAQAAAKVGKSVSYLVRRIKSRRILVLSRVSDDELRAALVCEVSFVAGDIYRLERRKDVLESALRKLDS